MYVGPVSSLEDFNAHINFTRVVLETDLGAISIIYVDY